MVNRILQILKHKNLTASRFADEIGVQRSSISHILSERNKPSLELIQKILNKYNEINSEWLLTGKEAMINEEPDLFSQSELEYNRSSSKIKREKELSKITNVTPVNLQMDTNEFTNKDTLVNNQNQNSNKIDLGIENQHSSLSKNKTIEKIVIFYNDKTCVEYSPE